MYPTIHNFDANPLHAYPAVGSNTGGSAGGSAGGASTPAASAPPRANGPPPSPPAAFPTLQVTIDPRFQVAPPVRAPSQPPGEGGASQPGAAPPPPPGHPAPGASGEPLDLSLERRLVEELASGSSGSAGASGAGPGAGAAAAVAEQEQEDPYEVLLGRYTEMGFTREEVAMALAVVGPDHGSDAERIVDACRKYKSICTMGFRPQHVVGALITHDGDADLAATTCLEAAS